jgi:hypothetical protein
MDIEDIYHFLITDETIKLPKPEILRFLLNTVLVLEGYRLCYRVDIGCMETEDVNSIMTKKIIELNGNFTSDGNEYEPYLFLKSNESIVNDNLSTVDGVGFLLKYPYTNLDFADTEIDRYIVVFTLEGFVFGILYQFFCPVDKFYTIIDQIKLDKVNINNIIEKYGYKCKITIMFVPSKVGEKAYWSQDLIDELNK